MVLVCPHSNVMSAYGNMIFAYGNMISAYGNVISAHVFACTYTFSHSHGHANAYTYTGIYVPAYTHEPLCVYVYGCVYIHRYNAPYCTLPITLPYTDMQLPYTDMTLPYTDMQLPYTDMKLPYTDGSYVKTCLTRFAVDTHKTTSPQARLMTSVPT